MVTSPDQYSHELFRPVKGMYPGTVVHNEDQKVLGRVKVEIPGLTLGLSKKHLPYYTVMQPPGLGASMYTSNFAVPQLNTSVMVMFPSDDIHNGIVVGALNNRTNMPFDQLNLAADYVHPKSSKTSATTNWDNVDDTTPGQKHFSPDMAEDYPGCHGWVDNALNWFKVNMFKRTVEFVTNSFTKFKIYGNGDTVAHITGNLKLVVEKDLYVEVRGNSDFLCYNSHHEHILGSYEQIVEATSLLEGKGGTTVKGEVININ